MRLIHTILISTLLAAMSFSGNAFSKKVEGFVFATVATGAQEVPANIAQGSGAAFVLFDEGLTEAHVVLKFDGVDSIIAAHFHCALAGMNGPVAFGLLSPGPLTEIGEEATVTLTNEDAVGDCTAIIGRPVNNIAALYFAMKEGLIYLNVHSTAFPPGEVRGQMHLIED